MNNKQIASMLSDIALDHPDMDPSCAERTKIRITDTFSISCQNDRNAILDIADKFKKHVKLTRVPSTKVSKAQRPAQSVVDNFLEDGEIDNAINYADCRGYQLSIASTKTGPEIIQKAKVIAPGFVFGIVSGNWSVTHLASGGAAACGKGCKKSTMRRWESVKVKPNFMEVCDAAACDYQTQGMTQLLDNIK